VQFDYIAIEKLRSGVNSGDAETLVINPSMFSRQIGPQKIDIQRSWGGVADINYQYKKDSFSIKFNDVTGATREQMDEFLYSAVKNQTFTFTDPEESNEIKAGVLTSFSRNRVSTGVIDWYTYDMVIEDL